MCGRRALARWAASASLAVAAACGRTEVSPAAAPSVGAPAESSPQRSADARPTAAHQDGASAAVWPGMIRDGRWDDAWRALEALGDEEKAQPEIRYVRARVALARGDGAQAVALLDGLEASLPLLADDIGRRRADGELAAGRFEEAGEWFAAHEAPAFQLDAAQAFEKAKNASSARQAADRVIDAVRHTRAQEAQARALRIRLAGGTPDDQERADARWLATHGADVSPVDGVVLLARVDPQHPLLARELLMRARVLSEAGRADDALRAIDSSAKAPGADKVSALERARARADALFRAHGRWSEAAKALAECAAAGGPHAAEDAFYAARALSRADRDDEAVAAYEGVERRYARSPWAEAAAFFAPYLRMLHADWRRCAAGFEAYERVHAGGEHDRDARRDGGLCALLSGDAKTARTLFERLSDDERGAPTASARMADMAALAALRDGDRTHAVALWTEVARARPLTWPALVARARLAQAGAPTPAVLESDPDEDGGEEAPLVVALPAPADMLHRLGLDDDAEAALHEREAAVAAGDGGRGSEALCAAYGELARAKRRYQIARTLPNALFTAAPGPRTRWAWDCAFPSPYAAFVVAAQTRESLPAGLLWAVMRQESGFDPEAVSPARAVGLMQLMPDTARRVAEGLSLPHDVARLTSPRYAVDVGARLLHQLIERFGGQIPLAVAAYNAGADPIERWLSRAQGLELDTFVERIPFGETRDYVARVMGNLAHYAYLSEGEAGVPRLDLDLSHR